jgi:kynureninase
MMAAMSDDLLAWREHFPILETSTYLISNSLGAMPRGVREALAAYTDAWATRGVTAWDQWWDMPVSVGDLIAPILGAGPGQISLHQNVTITQAIIASCFDFRPPRNRVVLSDMEFPSVKYFWQAQQGVDVVEVRGDGVTVPLENMLAAIDERTLLVPMSHVLFRSAFIQDAATIIGHAHRAGARVILDTFQSAGTVPLNVQELNADFCVGGVLKWLCGGPGVAYLYVRPDLRESLAPRLTGWMAHRRPFQFEGAMDMTSGPFRFLNGTPHIPALYAARPGLEIISRVGVENIRRKSLRQTALLVEAARERGFRVTAPADPAQRGGTIAIDAPNGYEVCQELIRRKFLVDYRPQAGIRVSPHFYNTDEEVLAVVEEIARICAVMPSAVA